MSLLRGIKGKASRGLRRATGGARDVRPPASIPDTPEARELCDRIAAIPFWFHSIDLRMGVVTPGLKSPELHRRELASLGLPDLRGKSVLDVGAWDGFYSFSAERLGAARVVALDSYMWAWDRDAKRRYAAECEAKGVPQQHPDNVPQLWNFAELPGKRGFDLAHAALRSRVDALVCDATEIDVASIGQFDVVLYLGVLYHMQNPLDALKRLRGVTREVAVIETEAVAFRGFRDRPMCEFFPPSRKLGGDPTNYWSPNAAALLGLCEAAGFSRVELMTRVPRALRGPVTRYRLVAHAYV